MGSGETWAAEAERGGTAVELSGSLAAFGAPPARATATVIRRSRWQRAVRALVGFGACWGLAVVAVFIPVAHFVLVPALLVAGPVVAILRLREAQTLSRVHGTCPRCGLEQDFKAGGRLRPGRALDCAGCRHQLVLTVEGA